MFSYGGKLMNKTLIKSNNHLYISRSQHYDNLQQADSQQQKQPLKDSTNTGTPAKQQKLNNNEDDHQNNQEPESTQQEISESSNQQQQQQQQQGSRSLQCLETLAQKAGIRIHDANTDDCKYDIANTLLNLDRGHDNLNKQEYHVTENMSDIKNQQQQVSLSLRFLDD